jgi:PAS domain S-box-containing protein
LKEGKKMEHARTIQTVCSNELTECLRRVEELEKPSRLREAQEEVKRLEALIQRHIGDLATTTEALEVGSGERRLAEEARSQLAAIMEHSQEAIIGKTTDGIITSWNAAAQRIFGYSAEEIVGQPVTILFPPELVDEEKFILRRIEEDNSVENYETVRLTKAGARIDVSITIAPIKDLSGKIIGLSSIKRNITARKQIEAILANYLERLEQSNKALQEFASVVSHDLQEPLRKIRLFGDRLRARYSGALDTEGLDYIERMQKASGRMRVLIDGLLSYSRIGTRAEPFSQVDLKALVGELVNDLEARIEETGGRVEIGDLPTIEANPDQMRQLFQNLISNALKYHGAEKPLVRVFSTMPMAGFYRIAVEDNGIGFDEKYIDRIFMVFQRLHGRNEFEGTGLGLAICRKIAEHHGGTITARSTPGKGSVFLVSLPLKQTSVAPTSALT